jgi:hypothetical protein
MPGLHGSRGVLRVAAPRRLSSPFLSSLSLTSRAHVGLLRFRAGIQRLVIRVRLAIEPAQRVRAGGVI